MLSHVMLVTRAIPSRVPCLLALLAGCATAQPLESPAAPEPKPAPPPAALPTPTPIAAVPDRGDATSVNGPEGLVRLCESLRDETSLTFPGSAVEQARAFEAHAHRRQTALAGRYVTVVPAVGFAFRGYDLGERRLQLDTERSLVLGDGAELFVPSREPAPGFVLGPEGNPSGLMAWPGKVLCTGDATLDLVLGPELADRVLAQRAEGKAGLRLIFRPTFSQLRKESCVWLGGGRVVKLEIEVVAAALVAPDGSVLARADGGEYGDASLGTPVRSPKVTIRKPRTIDGKDPPAGLAAALGVLAERARPCYERVLLVRPALRGTIVLGVTIGPGGRVETPHIEMSSLADDAVTNCVAKGAAKATIAGATAGQRFSVPLLFGSAED